MVMTPEGSSPSLVSKSVRTPLRVLLVEDSEDYAALIRSTLATAPEWDFELDHTRRLDDALDHLELHAYDVMLLDLSLPDAFGAFTIRCACARADAVPIIVLTSSDNDDLAMMAVRAGAQAYLVKQQIERQSLPATIVSAAERHRKLHDLYRGQSAPTPLIDSLTGLPGEEGLTNQLHHAIERALSHPHALALLQLRVDDFTRIERLLGQEGSEELLRTAAACLHSQMRSSDLIAHRSGPDFAALIGDVRSSSDISSAAEALLMAIARIELPVPQSTPGHREGDDTPKITLTASIGIAVYPVDGQYPEQLMACASEALATARGLGGNQACFSLIPSED